MVVPSRPNEVMAAATPVQPEGLIELDLNAVMTATITVQPAWLHRASRRNEVMAAAAPVPPEGLTELDLNAVMMAMTTVQLAWL